MSSACSPTSETLLIIGQGGGHLSLARGGIYTADLAAKERGIRKGGQERRVGKNRKGRQSTAPRCRPSPALHGWSLFIILNVARFNRFSVHTPIYLSSFRENCLRIRKPGGVIIYFASRSHRNLSNDFSKGNILLPFHCISVWVRLWRRVEARGLAEMLSRGPVCMRHRGRRDLPVIGWRGAL